jgi:hypothetical protein
MVAPVALPATTIIDTPKKMKAFGHVYRQVCRKIQFNALERPPNNGSSFLTNCQTSCFF